MLKYSYPDEIFKNLILNVQMIVSLVWSGEAAGMIESTGDATSMQSPASRQSQTQIGQSQVKYKKGRNI